MITVDGSNYAQRKELFANTHKATCIGLSQYEKRLIKTKGLRKIFGCKSMAARGEWRKLHSMELHDLYFSACFIRVIKIGN
jgi:hypothetical protein